MNAFNFRKWNTLLGWAVFAIALLTYSLTLEPTVSYWDCGEYISTAVKLEVGHPPGAPLFQMLGAFFAMFTSEVTEIAKMVNFMSALASAFTILFMFWTITMLAKKIANGAEISKGRSLAILGSGLVGSLAYTFSDSFWFSAVEGEVYAMSSFLMALLFWLGLRWEAEIDKWQDKNSTGAFDSPLKLVVAGSRNRSNNGLILGEGSIGNYWSSDVAGSPSYSYYFSLNLSISLTNNVILSLDFEANVTTSSIRICCSLVTDDTSCELADDSSVVAEIFTIDVIILSLFSYFHREHV